MQSDQLRLQETEMQNLRSALAKQESENKALREIREAFESEFVANKRYILMEFCPVAGFTPWAMVFIVFVLALTEVQNRISKTCKNRTKISREA